MGSVNVKQFAAFIKQSENIVAFGGAGASVERGMPDFRGHNVCIHQKRFRMPGKIVNGKFIPSGLPKREENEKTTDKKEDCVETRVLPGTPGVVTGGSSTVLGKKMLRRRYPDI